MADDAGKESVCFTCKKQKVTPWTCEVCERANLLRQVCSARCLRLHERDGRHRKELRLQQAKAIGLDAPPPRRGQRVQVRIAPSGESRRTKIRPDLPVNSSQPTPVPEDLEGNARVVSPQEAASTGEIPARHLRPSRVKKAGAIYPSIGCNVYRSRGPAICPNNKTISEKKVRESVLGFVRETIARPDLQVVENDPPRVAEIARQATEIVHQNRFKCAPARVRDQPLEVDANGVRPGYRGIGIFRRDPESAGFGESPTTPHLIFDRAGVLAVGGIASVDGDVGGVGAHDVVDAFAVGVLPGFISLSLGSRPLVVATEAACKI
jgi:hypothetical protein